MEWNNGAIALLLIMFLIPVGIMYFILKLIIKHTLPLNIFFHKQKRRRKYIYLILEIGLIILAVGFTVVILSSIYYLRGGSGLLE